MERVRAPQNLSLAQRLGRLGCLRAKRDWPVVLDNVMEHASHWMTVFGAVVWLTVFYALLFGGMVSTRGGM